MTPKEVWDFLQKVVKQTEEKKLTNTEILQIIGLLKCAQTSLMLRMDSHDYPFYESK